MNHNSNESTFKNKIVNLGKQNFYCDATFEITSRCNANCDCCYTLDNSAIDLDFKDVTKAIDKVADSGILTLNFTGGEPFIRNDFLKIMEYSIQKDFWHFSILSNGTLLNNEHFSFLKQNASYFSNFQMSIFSYDAKKHDEYMKIKGAHKKILNTADKLRSYGIPVTLSFNIFDFNFKDYQQTLYLMTEHSDMQQIGVTKLFDHCKGSCNKERLKESTTEKFYEKMLTSSPGLLKSQKKKMAKALEMKLSPEKTNLCTGIYTSIFIDSLGNLRPCPAFRRITAGNIFDEGSLHEIVEKQPIYKQIKSMRLSDIKKCSNCKFNNFCNFCIGLSHSDTNSFTIPSPQYCSFASAVQKL